MTRYGATLPEANIDLPIDEKNPHIFERESTDVRTDYDAFVAHKRSKTDTPAKRICIPRNAINVNKIGNIFCGVRWKEIAAVDEMFNENIEPVEENPSEFSTVSDNDEVAPESYSHAVLDPERRKSITRRCGTLDAGMWYKYRKEYDYNRNTCVS